MFISDFNDNYESSYEKTNHNYSIIKIIMMDSVTYIQEFTFGLILYHLSNKFKSTFNDG